MEQTARQNAPRMSDNGYLLLGAGLAVASMIIMPAIAARMGLGSSLTGALRIALMKASSQATAVACRSVGNSDVPCR